jgi:hypothetical protein
MLTMGGRVLVLIIESTAPLSWKPTLQKTVILFAKVYLLHFLNGSLGKSLLFLCTKIALGVLGVS